MLRYRSFIVLLLVFCPLMAIGEEQAVSSEHIDYFERKIRPLLVERCYSCHSAEAKILQGGLLLDSASGLQQGGDSGPAIVSGMPEESLLIQAVRQTGDIQMPPEGKLPQAEIDELIHWVKLGAPFPPSTGDALPKGRQIDYEAGRQHWAFQPVQEQPLPALKQSGWPRQRMDHFILGGMEREGLEPAIEADRATLIRRLYFDVIGLPPTPEAVQKFVHDDSPEAYLNLVEELLQSPHYGEKWGRMWLDMTRYIDKPEGWLSQEGEPHLYRDWVVQAFNRDLPYNEFVHQQLAADVLPNADPANRAALGFLGLSPEYWKELKLPCEVIKVIVADEWEERVDAVSSTFLGLTVSCARCHDHKFDPISSEDYYALAGVLASCRLNALPLVTEEQYQPVRAAKAEIAKLEGEITQLKADITKRDQAAKEQTAQTQANPPASEPAAATPTLEQQIEQRNTRIQELKQTPHFDEPLAKAVTDESLFVERAGATPQDGTRLDYKPLPLDLPLFVRGDPNRPGPVVQRRFLKVLSPNPQPFQQGSGRLELAQAITTEAAPLTARVIVNRIWLAHFGQGLVNTPSNFGTQGGRPTHPDLLNDLAARFIANGWSLKWLHREILLSATWRQSAHASATAQTMDPGNKWLSHMNRRRLDFEAWRDAMLSVSGTLDLTLGGQAIELDAPTNARRTMYCTIHRQDLAPALQIHDFPDPNQHSPQRSPTTTPLQGLYALNGPLLSAQAEKFLLRLQTEHPTDDAARISRAYWFLYSREPSGREVELGTQFLGSGEESNRPARWLQYAHALLASNEFLFVD